MKIALLGGGVMGEAIISGLINRGSIEAKLISLSDIDVKRLKTLHERYGIICDADKSKIIKDADIVILAVKPQVLAEVTREIKDVLGPQNLVVSIVAGVKIQTLTKYLKHDSIVRTMPNTPAQIGKGITVWTATDTVSQKQKEMARTIIRALGREVYVADEKYIDMATAISGSGPAYIFLIMEALTDAGVHIGMPREFATELVLQTLLGSAHLAEDSQKHFAELRNMVTSPGGTTAEGLRKLEEGRLRATINKAVSAAYDKAQILGKEQE